MKTPLTIDPLPKWGCHIQDDNGERIALVADTTMAEEIVQAVNYHDPLVAQRDALVAALSELATAVRGDTRTIDNTRINYALIASDVALDLVKGGECPHQQPDGCCGHPDAMTLECHLGACPEESQ